MEPLSPTDYVANYSYFAKRIMFRAVIDRYQAVDNFSTWVLGATGLAAAFVSTNLDKLNTFLKPEVVPFILVLFIASILAGLMQKCDAMQVGYACKVDDQTMIVFNSLAAHSASQKGVQPQINIPIELQLPSGLYQEIVEQIGTIIETAQMEFKNSAGWPFSHSIQRGIDGSKKDTLYGLKLGTKAYFSQLRALFFQVVTLFMILLIALLCFWGRVP